MDTLLERPTAGGTGRLAWADLLRVLTTFAVVLLHILHHLAGPGGGGLGGVDGADGLGRADPLVRAGLRPAVGRFPAGPE